MSDMESSKRGAKEVDKANEKTNGNGNLAGDDRGETETLEDVGKNTDKKEVVQSQPLATTRSRRSNAGNRMGHLIQDEEDEFYTNIYGGFQEEEDDDDFEDGDFDEEDSCSDNEDVENDADSVSNAEESDDMATPQHVERDDEEVEQPRRQKNDCKKDIKPRVSKKSRSGSKPTKQKPSSPFTEGPSYPSDSAYNACARICSVCLGDQSGGDDEVIECDSCGVTVHESCYGISGEEANDQDNVSVHSNISSESTEPWFCEPCRRSIKNPHCELCPNTGGIFKETDTGRWVHMVCALYTRGVTFENTDNLTGVSLFELSYALFGSKACIICEDRRLARSGICIGCDAGLCKTFFHPTCAQKEGFLVESHSDEVDPYFAQCKQHADKTTIKKKKKTCTALFARLKRVQSTQVLSDRIKRKLYEITKQQDPHSLKWTSENPPPIPKKTSRMLMTCPSLIIKLTKKSELMGLDPNSAFMSVQDEIEMARQKWHIPPAFELEFIAYCLDRTTRMISMKKRNVELVNQNLTLKNEEASLREKYNSIKDIVTKLRSENEVLIKEARALQKAVTMGIGKPFSLPLQAEQLIARCTNSKGKIPTKGGCKAATKASATYECGKCASVKDQHLLALCDTCKFYTHIYCLDPPLSRVPKKTKFGGWQCSDCSERDEEEQEEAMDEQNLIAIQEVDGPRRLRERIKYPEKYCHESMMLADFWSTSKKKSKKSSKSSKAKKIKVEV